LLKSYQQFADLMVALLRNREVRSVSRSGFTDVDPYIPEISQVDQVGRPRKPGQDPIPDDPLLRLQQQQSQGTLQGFTGEGGFGTVDTGPRGAMPGHSVVTVTLVIARNLQTPVPKATLSTIGAPAPNTNNAPAPGLPNPGDAPAPGGGRGNGREGPGGEE
jgi:hypothetical protein